MPQVSRLGPLPGASISGVPMMSTHTDSSGAWHPETRRLLFVVRESSTGAERELANLATDAFLRHSYRDDVAQLLRAGLEPLNAPTLWGGKALPFTRGRGALVRVGRAWALFALSSAAKDTDGIQNEFTQAFVAAMDEARPHAVITTSINRITRHGHHVSAAVRSFTKHKPILECDEGTLDFRSPLADGEFQVWASYATKDRNTIVARMEAGHRRAHKNELFSFAGTSLPDGYQRTTDGEVLLEPTVQVVKLNEVFGLLADPAMSVHKVALHLQASGVFFPRRSLPNGNADEPVTLDTAKDIVGRLISRLDTYETGRFSIDRTPVLPVYFTSRDDSDTDQEPGDTAPERFDYQLPLPAGGWATPEQFAAIRSSRASFLERQRIAETNPHKNNAQRPLVGYRWRDGNDEWGLISGSRSSKPTYWLVRRGAAKEALNASPGSQAWRRSLRRGWHRVTVKDTRFVCAIDAASLHRSVADTFGTMTDFALELPSGGLVAPSEASSKAITAGDEVAALKVELGQAERIREKAKAAFYSLDDADDPLRPLFLRDLRLADEKVHRLSEALSAVRAPSASPREQPSEVETDGSSNLLLLARLRSTTGKMPSADCAVLQALLYGFTVRFNPAVGDVAWSASLALPGSGGAPAAFVSGSGTARVLPSGASKLSPSVRGQQALLKSAEGAPLSQQQSRDARAELVRLGMQGTAAKSLLGAPDATRRILIHHLLQEAAPVEGDPAFAEMVLSRYLDNQDRGQYEWNAAAGSRQALLDVVAQAGPIDRFALMAALGVTSSWTQFYAQIRTAESDWLAPVLTERYYEGASKDGGQKVRVRPRTCPHCGSTVDIVARVRECPAGLLCSACLRMPVLDSPVFPRDYRSLAKRPQRSRAKRVPQPSWWADLRQACHNRPDANLTVLGDMLDRPRWQIEEAADVLGLAIASWGSFASGWSDEALRHAYLVEDRRLVDLADEIGVSTGTLSKRLAKAAALKRPRSPK